MSGMLSDFAKSHVIFQPLLLTVVVLTTLGLAQADVAAAESSAISYEHDVRPILVRHCDRCHGTKNRESDLQLNSRSSVFRRRDENEAVVVPGEPQHSRMLLRLTDESVGDIMPPDGEPLRKDELVTLYRWIEQGAVWPDELAEAGHWAWQAVQRPGLPDPESAEGAIDQFVRRRLKRQAISPTQPLDRHRLIRRVSLALTGVPPTSQDVSEFVSDDSPLAYEKVVDRLLNSERYGERWAIPWMDLARYADSNGFQADQLRDNWAWRDWVIRAFNDDMPFDRFVTEQLAGDLLPQATLDQKIATGFHRMTTCNVEAGVHPEANRINQVIDRVNTTATAFLGVTLECAQCHDHKYDPFTQQDYYRLFAYFNSSPLEVKQTEGVTWDFYGPKLDLPESERLKSQIATTTFKLQQLRAERKERIEQLQPEYQRWIDELCSNPDPDSKVASKLWEAALAESRTKEQVNLLKRGFETQHEELATLRASVGKLQKELDSLGPDSTLVMVEMESPRETFVLTRGDYDQPASQVQPGVPELLASTEPLSGTGDRLELARWLTAPTNPLLARVTVNRWWAELFGIGLVSTPEDFGTQSEMPSHPDLLDWLASELMSGGWSMKHIHKQIVMSQTWQQDAAGATSIRSMDPSNRLMARGPRFRMPAELIRDNALAISGLLSDEMFGPPIMPYQPAGVWRSVGRNQPKWKAAENEARFRRGVYVIWKRAAPYPGFVTFDAPDRSSCTVQRTRSNTPLQALTLLNDRAYSEMAVAMADRILREVPTDSDIERVRYAMSLAVSRQATTNEIRVLGELLNNERIRLDANPKLVEKRLSLTPPGVSLQSADHAEVAAWFAVCNTILNLDETMTP